jgi:hypothetical protein
MKKILIFILKFILFLAIIYVLWLPFSKYYLIIRLKLSYYLLNLFGFYPKFELKENIANGELFSFLPFLALMLAYYGKNVLKRYKVILLTGLILFIVEVLGRFLDKLYFFYPKNYVISTFAIFFLATLRVAIPFVAWVIIISKDNIRISTK